MKKKTIELTKIYFKALFTFIILVLVWHFFHELIHLSICEFLVGQDATITINFHNDFVFRTKCGGDVFLSVEGYKVFFYALSPYIVEVFTLYFLFKYRTNNLALKILPYILVSDGIYNLFMMFYKVGDFYLIYSILPIWQLSPILIGISIILIFIPILSRDLKDYKRLKQNKNPESDKLN